MIPLWENGIFGSFGSDSIHVMIRCNLADKRKCDAGYVKDCSDGSDDTTAVCGANCENVEGGGFASSDGECIKASQKCNAVKHCPDGSDETTYGCGDNCSNVAGGGFECSDGQECILAAGKCNGIRDCFDGSDETTHTCGANCERVEGRFACSNGSCIKVIFKCDGHRDCTDGSDETTETCGTNCGGVNFQCADGKDAMELVELILEGF